MKVLAFLLILCASSVCGVNLTCQCGVLRTNRIVGGKQVRKNAYPWMVSMNNECGGSIITQYHILTAAHCTEGQSPSFMKVSVGRHYRFYGKNEHLQEHRVLQIFEHPDYANSRLFDDISILVLATPIIFNQHVGPVCMPYAQYDLVGSNIKVIGWGFTRGTGDPNVLQEVELKVISYSDCQESWGDLNALPTQICVYSPKKDTCNGDSGGPLFFQDPTTERYTQIALVSYGPPACGTDPRPSVNTDIFSYIDWIKEVVRQSPHGVEICMKVEDYED